MIEKSKDIYSTSKKSEHPGKYSVCFLNKGQLTFGADPEFFILNNDGEIISPALLELEGRLEPIIDDNKHPTYIIDSDYRWIMDGGALELNFNRSFIDSRDLWDVLKMAEDSAKKLVSNIGNFDLLAVPAAKFNLSLYRKFLGNEKIYQSLIFGCDPDRDVIIPDKEDIIFNAMYHKYRYGGGHIHIGGKNSEDVEFIHKNYVPFIHLLAIFVGNLCIARSEFPEQEKLRSIVYGKPGRFRFQEHGIEYRSPSNAWVNNRGTIEKIFEYSKIAFDLVRHENKAKKIIKKNLMPTIEAIENADRALANEIINSLEV